MDEDIRDMLNALLWTGSVVAVLGALAFAWWLVRPWSV